MMMQYLVGNPLPLGVDAYIDPVVSNPVQPTIVSMQSSMDTTPIFWGDASLVIVIMHPIQPMVEEVLLLVQYLVNLTLLFEGDASFNHVVIILDPAPSEEEIVLLSPSTLP
jgi:hypothetical protein